jgi:hypothetical protein
MGHGSGALTGARTSHAPEPLMAAPKTLTPEQRSERARKAASARTTVDAHIRALVDAAPEFTDEQLQRLTVLLAPAKPPQ